MGIMDYLPQFGQNVDQEMPQDDTLMQIDFKRKLALADALRQQQMPEGQMVSGHYVAPSWTQYLANAVNKYQGGKQEREALNKFGEYQKGKQAKLANLLNELGQGKQVTNMDNTPYQVQVSNNQTPPTENFGGMQPIETGMKSINVPMTNTSTSYKPFSQQEYMAKVLKTMPELAPKMLEAGLSNQFKEESPLVVGNNLVTKTGKLLYSAPDKEAALKSNYANVQQDPQTGKFFGVNIKTSQVEEIPGAAMSPKPAMTPYEEATLGLRRKELSTKEANNFDNETIDMLADQALTGDKSVFSGRGMTGANLGAIRQRMNQKMRDRGMSGADIAAANVDFAGALAGGRTAAVKGANVLLAGSEFQNLLPLAEQASAGVSRSKILPFGKVQIMFDEQTNDPALRQFAAVNNGIINTYARAISPTGVPTVSDKDHARKILSTAYDQKSYQATLDMLNKEIDAAMKSPAHVKEMLKGQISGKTSPAAFPSQNDIAAEIARRQGR